MSVLSYVQVQDCLSDDTEHKYFPRSRIELSRNYRILHAKTFPAIPIVTTVPLLRLDNFICSFLHAAHSRVCFLFFNLNSASARLQRSDTAATTRSTATLLSTCLIKLVNSLVGGWVQPAMTDSMRRRRHGIAIQPSTRQARRRSKQL